MKTTTGAAAALLATTTLAHAGGIERANQSVGFLFEQGGYTEFSISRVSPKVSGEVVAGAPGPFAGAAGAGSGDMTGGYTSVGLAVKWDMSERLSFGIQYEQPYGADVSYAMGTGYPYAGSNADLNVDEIKVLAKYKLDENWSVYGGLRFQNVGGNVDVVVPALSLDYSLSVERSTELGYLVGVAYEKPEIAMRIALTYNSAITHKFNATEFGGASTEFETEFPQSINLEAQSGIAEGTLVLASIRWVNWSAFDISPTAYGSLPGNPSLVDYENDVITYTVGVARRFTDNFAGIATISYEKSEGGFVGNLGPTDGRTSIGLAGRYDVGNATITGGVNYSWLGDAETEAPVFGGTLSEFKDNTALAVGLRIGYHF
ncbi:OmpP1/FadL family transporter [Vannielia litorea]|uniref:Long-chain fatty acid transport protein n=1 Tax=Vannielia litorea TaxID=1217970 RepID=A0A1N6FBI9_9RHOB|nr:outer membrane protein transport protein [Vannielia litorea]SIN92620.1 Long-chain fatty acid transport protein [Vannielia litorea]